MFGFLIALAVGAVCAYALHEHYPKGHGPLDLVPEVVGKPSGSPSYVVAPATGIRYKTWTWPPVVDGSQFHVAARADGKLGWVSYWSKNTGSAQTRTFYAGWTPAEGDQVGLLKKDFGV